MHPSLAGRAAARRWPDCVACRRPMTLDRRVALTGEEYCTRHEGEPLCQCCRLPAGSRSGDCLPQCLRCSATAVRGQADVKRVLPPITAQLRALGIRTTSRVRVRLAPASEFARAFGGAPSDDSFRGGNPHVLGATLSAGSDVLDLMVLESLPALMFGVVAAHEAMHVYLVQQSFGELPHPLNEGLCQLLAYAWLRRQDGVVAAAQRHLIESNPDPVYGDGFRQVRAAAERTGIRRTLAHAKRHQTLPVSP